MFRSILVHLGSFHNCMKLVAKHTELVQLIQKFVPRSHDGIFRNECNQSTPLHPKLMFRPFRSIWMHLGSFRNCMKLVAKHTKQVQFIKKFVPRSHVVVFSQRTDSIHPIGSNTHVFVCFIVFGCIWDRFVAA